MEVIVINIDIRGILRDAGRQLGGLTKSSLPELDTELFDSNPEIKNKAYKKVAIIAFSGFMLIVIMCQVSLSIAKKNSSRHQQIKKQEAPTEAGILPISGGSDTESTVVTTEISQRAENSSAGIGNITSEGYSSRGKADPGQTEETAKINNLLDKGGVVGNAVTSKDIMMDAAAHKKVGAADSMLTADKDSGKFQVGNLIFNLPTTLQSMLDNGVSLLSLNSDASISNRELKGRSEITALLYYRGCTFSAVVQNKGDESIDALSGHVVSVTEDMADHTMKYNVNHIYSAGGLCIDKTRSQIIAALKEYSAESNEFPGTGVKYMHYGYISDFNVFKAQNFIKFTLNTRAEEPTVKAITVCKNTDTFDITEKKEENKESGKTESDSKETVAEKSDSKPDDESKKKQSSAETDKESATEESEEDVFADATEEDVGENEDSDETEEAEEDMEEEDTEFDF